MLMSSCPCLPVYVHLRGRDDDSGLYIQEIQEELRGLAGASGSKWPKHAVLCDGSSIGPFGANENVS